VTVCRWSALKSRTTLTRFPPSTTSVRSRWKLKSRYSRTVYVSFESTLLTSTREVYAVGSAGMAGAASAPPVWPRAASMMVVTPPADVSRFVATSVLVVPSAATLHVRPPLLSGDSTFSSGLPATKAVYS